VLGALVVEERATMSRWLFPGFLALTLALYAMVLGGKPFLDDWVYVLAEPARHILGAFGELHPGQFYRPLPLFLVAVLQLAGHGSPVPIHLLQCVLHALLAVLVVSIAIRRGTPRGWAILAGVFMTASQSAAAAVGGYDTLSITLSTFFGMASLSLLLGPGRYGAAAAAFLCSLLCKESALGYLPLLALAAIRAHPTVSESSQATPFLRRRGALFSFLLAAIAGGYLAWRTHLGAFAPSAGSGTYNMNLGGGILLNLAMLWFAALLPISSVDVFTALVERNVAVALVGLAAVAVVLALLLLGFIRKGRWGRGLALIAAGSVALSPVLPLVHVSELYAYTLLPFAALLLGESVASLAGARSGRFARGAVVSLVVLLLAANSTATMSKALAMAENGRRAERLLGAVAGEMRSLPKGGTLTLVDPVLDHPNYSVFRFRSFLLVPDETLVERSGRGDVKLLRVEASRDSSSYHGTADRVLTLDGHAQPVRL